MYELAQNIFCHTRDLRTIDYYQRFILTGGSDKKINLFTYKNGEIIKEKTSDAIEKNVLCVKINRFPSEDNLFAIAGFYGGQIVGYDIDCTPIWMINHSSNISSLDFINSDNFVAGSWDGIATVWNLSQKKKVSQFNQHKYAATVFYYQTCDLVISGSQDKALNMWSWRDGKLLKRHQNAHNDIIRQIALVQDVGFITCSNDQTLKLWSSDLEEIQNFIGHTAFVFSVKSIGFGLYISGGEDKTIKIWRDQTCEQTIQLPASVWQLVYDPENQDIIAGCSDGSMRIFTKDLARRASHEVLEAFNKQVLEAASKKSGMSAEEIKKLPSITLINNAIGKKQGEIRVFRNNLSPEAYMWQGGKWVKIGDVITENTNQTQGSGNASQYYHGDVYFDAGQYDHVFDVDDESGVQKKIPFNDGGNPLEAAEKYCMREGLSKGYIEQIRKFLMANSSRIPRSALKQQISNLNTNQLKLTPRSMPIEFNGIRDPQALMQKILQFNENAQGQKLNERQINHIERMATQLSNQKNYYQVKFDDFQISSLKKLLKWPKPLKFPVWDLLRAFLKHYQSQELFSGLSGGSDIISQLCAGLESENKEAIYTLILRTMSNVLIQNTNKNSMLKFYELTLGSIISITKTSPGLVSKNYLYSMSSFLYNYSIAILQKNLEKEEDTIKQYADVSRMRLQIENEEQNMELILQGIANVLFKHYKKYGNYFGWVKGFLPKCKNFDLVNDLKMLIG